MPPGYMAQIALTVGSEREMPGSVVWQRTSAVFMPIYKPAHDLYIPGACVILRTHIRLSVSCVTSMTVIQYIKSVTRGCKKFGGVLGY